MSLIEIYVYQDLIDQKVGEVQSKIPPLQELYNLLIDLGVEAISIEDLRQVIEESGSSHLAEVLKQLVLRGKDLTIGGIELDSSVIKLNEGKVKMIQGKSRSLDPGRTIQYLLYTIIGGVVSTIPNLEDEFKEYYTVYGTTKTQEVVSDIAAVCVAINAVLDKIGEVDTHHPMKDPENWWKWNSVTKEFSANVHRVAQYVI